MLRVVIVNFKHDPDIAMRGVLWGYRGAWLTLRDVSLLRSPNASTPMDGEAVVHRADVAFLQVLP